MLNYYYENAKKVLMEQHDMKGISNIYRHRDYKGYFNRYSEKYFVHLPNKKDKRQNYNEYYREVKNKSDADDLCTYFERMYKEYYVNIEDNELYDWQVENLEITIAKLEIAVGKIITCQSPRSPEYSCTKDEIIKYMETRDSMIEKVGTLQTRTVEHRRMMWD